jgi:hypothetical protein
MTRLHPLPFAVLALAACGRGNPGSWAGDTARPGADAPLACHDDATPLAGGITPSGLSVDAILLDLATTPPVDARYAAPLGGADTVLSLGFTPIGGAIWHTRTPPADTGAPDTGPATGAPTDACPDALEVPGRISLSTAEGQLAESADASAWVDESGGPATLTLSWPDTATTGTLDPGPVLGDTAWDEVTLQLATTLGPAPTGQLDARATAAATTPDGPAQGLIAPLLRWPPQFSR